MAPMAGITGPAFRRSVRGFGAGLVFTEMISAQGIVHDNQHTLAYLACTPADHPIGFQLFAAEPAVLARAARRSLAAGADLIDLNLACPVHKVMKTGAGAALLGTPDLAVACVQAVVQEVAGEAPVTVKIRAGVRGGDEAGLRVTPRLVAAGAAAVCIHPRYADQLYKGTADHRLTLALVRELPVPVIASGDIATVGPDGRVDRTGCAGLLDGGVAAVMVARAALGRPWVFEELLEGRPAPPRDERRRALIRFVDNVSVELGSRSVGYLRRFWPRFRRSGALTPALAAQLMTAADLAAVSRLVRVEAEETHPERAESV